MSVSESEIELLEAYLDGELPAEESATLRQRLQGDLALASAMESLSSDRLSRIAAFRSFEPSEAVAQRVVMRIEGAVDRESIWSGRLSKLRAVSAAAACILVGFIVGWVGRGTGANGQQDNLFLANGTSANPVVAPPAAANGPTAVSFPIRDQHGNVLGYQRFDSPQRANEFIDDLTRLQQRQQQQLQSGNLTYTSEGKF
jgi:anti-sigma factor RsiW